MEIILYALFIISIVLMVGGVIAAEQACLRLKRDIILWRERKEKRVKEQQAMYEKAKNEWEDEQQKIIDFILGNKK